MELSFSEIILILVIALVVMGPKDIVNTATQLGKWSAKIKTQINNFKIMLTEEVMQDERAAIEETKLKISQTVQEFKQDVKKDIPSTNIESGINKNG